MREGWETGRQEEDKVVQAPWQAYKETNNMAPKDKNSLMERCLFLLTLVQTAEAFDGGDAAALLLGATVTLVGICACLGWYARTRNGQF
ncbi:hypothetical protein G5714_005039 [Onychostoma macrolepis]|uniref:Small integral membrane protein 30 n=2 Tax=Onychostoma macrolepis TaxID=369639 RepID=A0A7J6D6C5_9TELE|nr:hypothetical protein G5714_005039 [Onychostoma macrolepis]